jgi:hypothetical protein
MQWGWPGHEPRVHSISTASCITPRSYVRKTFTRACCGFTMQGRCLRVTTRGHRQAMPMPSAVHPQGAGRHRGITTMCVARSTIRSCPFHVSQADSWMRCSSSPCFPLRQAHVVILSHRAQSRMMYVFVCILTVCWLTPRSGCKLQFGRPSRVRLRDCPNFRVIPPQPTSKLIQL